MKSAILFFLLGITFIFGINGKPIRIEQNFKGDSLIFCEKGGCRVQFFKVEAMTKDFIDYNLQLAEKHCDQDGRVK